MEEATLGEFTVAISTVQQMLIVSSTVLEVTEGSTASATLALAEQPSNDVTVMIVAMGGDSDLMIEGGTSVVFTPLNWTNPAPVVFRAESDFDQLNGSATFECRSDGLATVTLLVTEQDITPDNVLVTTANNLDWGTVDPAGGDYPVGSSVQVTASPLSYFDFEKWSGDYSGTDNPITVVMDSNVTLHAEFREQVTTNHATPYWWLASLGHTSNFESAELLIGTNGIPLWQSYIAGLDPTDPESRFTVSLAPGPDANTWILQWNPVTNRLYTVLQSTNLDLGFTALPGASTLPASVQSFTNFTSDPPGILFYRLQVQKP
jgi:hypothetical protein